MAANELIPWINSAGEGGVRNSMQEYPGKGTNGPFEFNFAGGYIDPSHVKAYRYDPVSARTYPQTLTFLGPNQVRTSDVIPVGQYVVLYRDTPKNQPLVDYSEGAVMDEANLDKSNDQSVFIAAEMLDRFDAINATSSEAIDRSVTALNTANSALSKSDTAIKTADAATATAGSAVITANGAVTTANAATQTANGAKATAEGIDAKAQSALDASANAVTTANGAKATANAIDGKAQSALDASTNAVNTASAANTKADGAVATANAVGSKADSAVSTANGAKETADAASAAVGSKVNRAGDTMTGALKNTTASGSGAAGAFHTTGDIGGAFVDWVNARIYGVQVDAARSTSAYGGIRWTRWGGRHLAAIDAYEGGSGSTQPTIVMQLANVTNAWTFSPYDISRGAGGYVWGSWNFDPNSKANVGGQIFTGEIGSRLNGDQGYYGRFGQGYIKLARWDYGGYIDLMRAQDQDYRWRIHYEYNGDNLELMSNGGQTFTFTRDGNIYCGGRGWVWGSIDARAWAGARVQWDSGAIEVGPIGNGTIDLPAPYVCVGARTCGGSSTANCIWLRGVILRNQ
ncbi:hypothetical protein [Burkholderia phage Bp-AMP2]|uniref:Bacteriophage T7 tail fibre protein-like N-terminal domain-containing protein n=2 Tax=Ampunavirus BpAMP1 TaxID=2733589 RepID=A0A0A8KXN2_9CAUD|nr:hypothetical protein [Burkholderia phage Bp-AMP2]CDL65236.1 hypothetical protein [Burkholderia phage Bp-AMP3]